MTTIMPGQSHPKYAQVAYLALTIAATAAAATTTATTKPSYTRVGCQSLTGSVHTVTVIEGHVTFLVLLDEESCPSLMTWHYRAHGQSKHLKINR